MRPIKEQDKEKRTWFWDVPQQSGGGQGPLLDIPSPKLAHPDELADDALTEDY